MKYKNKKREILCVITGERGIREITKPLFYAKVKTKVYNWKIIKHNNKLPFFTLCFNLYLSIRSKKYSIIFTDMHNLFLLTMIFLAKIYGAKVILRVRGNSFVEIREMLKINLKSLHILKSIHLISSYFLEKLAFLFVNEFVPVSKWVADSLKITSKSFIVNIPCEEIKFKKKKSQNILNKEFKLLAITNFDYYSKIKGLEDFILKYSDFLEKNNFTIAIAGSGLYFKDFIKKTKGKKFVNYLGYVKNINYLYQSYDTLIHFSYLDAYPYVTLEAQASKLPVMVNNCCGMVEQIENNKSGIIISLKDIKNTEKKLIEIKDSKELRNRLASNGFKSIVKNNNYSKIGDELKNFLFYLERKDE